MNLIPDPLHPAIVHFPIVLILLGCGAAVVATVWRKTHLPGLAALLLVLGALGCWAAVKSGESDGGLLEGGSPPREALVDAHENWAKRTLAISTFAAFAAATSVMGARWPRFARTVAVLAALASVAAAYSVYQTGHRGGQLVYQHGAGVALAASKSAPAPNSPPKADRD